MIERAHPRPSLVCQCRLLGLTRSSVYAPARGEESAVNLALMRRMGLVALAPKLGTPVRHRLIRSSRIC